MKEAINSWRELSTRNLNQQFSSWSPALGDISHVKELIYFTDSVQEGLDVKVLTERKNLDLHPYTLGLGSPLLLYGIRKENYSPLLGLEFAIHLGPHQISHPSIITFIFKIVFEMEIVDEFILISKIFVRKLSLRMSWWWWWLMWLLTQGWSLKENCCGGGGGGRLFDEHSRPLRYAPLARFRSSNLRDSLLISWTIPLLWNWRPPWPIAGAVQQKQHRIDKQWDEKEKGKIFWSPKSQHTI